MQDVISIKSQAKRNVIVSVIIAMMGLCIALLMLTILPATFYFFGIFLVSASIVAFLIAWVKYREPQFSFKLSKTSILYLHRHGQWQLDWRNIQRIDVPKISSGLRQESLDMIAIKIKDYSVFLDQVSPRLMTNMLMEQRPLLLLDTSSAGNCSDGQCYGEGLLEDDVYKADNGQVYKGIKAMFANRMAKLRMRLGYDIFVAGSELDRSEQDFVALLRQCHQQVVSQ